MVDSKDLIYRKNKNKFQDQIVPWISLTALVISGFDLFSDSKDVWG